MKTLTSAITPVLFLAVASFAGTAAAEPAPPDAVTIQVNLVDAKGTAKSIGTITASQSGFGLMLKPALTGLPPGLHGFHVHENPSCDPAEKDGQPAPAQAAGGHLDPAKTARHEGPYGTGHLGDLPALYVDADGKAETTVVAPRLKLADIEGHSLMIHAGGDNLSDKPSPLGGGGARIACGVVPAPKKQ
ncbi:MAG TPA: superoxide dismutase [Cu-Zn] SodC [Candidatus Binatia bacterium]|jgi:Cu-Zn family superoxide dismutase